VTRAIFFDLTPTFHGGRWAKIAEAIALARDPIADISELERVRFVMKDGQLVRNDLASHGGASSNGGNNPAWHMGTPQISHWTSQRGRAERTRLTIQNGLAREGMLLC
jgi:hypothetical protein